MDWLFRFPLNKMAHWGPTQVPKTHPSTFKNLYSPTSHQNWTITHVLNASNISIMNSSQVNADSKTTRAPRTQDLQEHMASKNRRYTRTEGIQQHKVSNNTRSPTTQCHEAQWPIGQSD